MNAHRHKLKFALIRNDSGNWTDNFDENGVVVLRSTEQTVGGGWKIADPARLGFNPPLPEDAFLKAGDIVITKSSGSSLHIGKASLVDEQIEELRCTFSNFMQRLRCKPTYSPRLVWYFLNSATGRAELDRASSTSTGLANLNGTIIGNLDIAFPPLSEQRRIAEYLDEATGKVDRLVALRRRQMELLREQRAALIQQAVTRGLNPNVRFKPCGMEWIEDIPEHWRITRLNWLATRIGDGLHGTPKYVDDSPYRFINGNNLSGGSVAAASAACVSQDEFHKHKIALGETSLLMSINGTIGNIAYYRGESIILGKSAAYINCEKALLRDYLFFLLQSEAAGSYFRREATGTTIFNLSLASIRKFPIVLPPLDEQRQIVGYIEQGLEKLDGLLSAYTRQLELLTEYRAALIHESVTGQRAVPK